AGSANDRISGSGGASVGGAVVEADYVDAYSDGESRGRERRLDSLISGQVEDPAVRGLARRPEEDRPPEDPQSPERGENRDVVLCRLAEAEPGIDDDLFSPDTRPNGPLDRRREIGDDLGHEARIA